MNFQPIIAKRRDGGPNTEAELRFLADGAASGEIPDYQIAAWLMAAYIHPLTHAETAWLTLGMADSGERIDLTGLPKPWVDKHSSGGVGDKTTIVLLPLLAACGITLVKMSGRGLGVTGGTVDKLCAIPGFRVDLSPQEMKDQAAKIGLALTGQTPNLAPADKVIYALRDVTETVESIPLLVSSILSKKIAGGAETVVLDVKSGSGAFMKTEEGAIELAKALAATGKEAGLNIRLAVTAMDEPLGQCIGNALEIREALDVLEGMPLSPSSLRFRRLCVLLASETLVAAGISKDDRDAEYLAEKVLTGGQAAEKAREWIAAQGGPLTLAEVRGSLAKAPTIQEVLAPDDGWVERIHAGTIGLTVIDLGGGRHKKDDILDLSVGIELFAPIGTEVRKGQVLARIHARNATEADIATTATRGAITISATPVATPPLILAQF